MMITKKQIDLLFAIYNNNGKITSGEQEVYTSMNRFYQAVTQLTRMKLITASMIEIADKRFNVYELTMRGLTLIKILLGEDY